MEETWAGCIRSDKFQLIKQNEKKGKEKNIFQRYLDECQFNVIISYKSYVNHTVNHHQQESQGCKI